ncbi:hypothetical protein CCMSSC00406_0008266 [Pleurotus cornucopiae]|uniref:Uncharacterized protein n=1 Tax=Pleurotus cornucopiae TaxID=5321 RepID=A0ACB7JAF3_PLECO|nr:hypothetical protein CCMSSC00406_0008266 [Pleurotus cornucopiae]
MDQHYQTVAALHMTIPETMERAGVPFGRSPFDLLSYADCVPQAFTLRPLIHLLASTTALFLSLSETRRLDLLQSGLTFSKLQPFIRFADVKSRPSAATTLLHLITTLVEQPVDRGEMGSPPARAADGKATLKSMRRTAAA